MTPNCPCSAVRTGRNVYTAKRGSLMTGSNIDRRGGIKGILTEEEELKKTESGQQRLL